MAELLAAGGVTASYARPRPSRSASRCWTPSWRRRGRSPPRTCGSASAPPASSTSCASRPSSIERFGAEVIPHYVISKCESVSDVLEVAILLRGGRAAPARRRRAADDRIVPAVRDHRRPAGGGTDGARAPWRRPVPRLARRARRRPGGDARVLRQQQGRRLPRGEVGALPGRDRPGRGHPRPRGAPAPLPRPRRHGGTRRRSELRGRPRAGARAASPARSASPSRAR